MNNYFKNNNTTSKYFPLLCIGMMINGIARLVDRFVVEIPEDISLVLVSIAAILMISSIILMHREKRHKEDK